MTQPHILLMDASGFAYRAHHAMNPVYRDTDGEPIGAVLGFMSMSWRMLGAAAEDHPTHAAAVFDFPGPTFRHKLSPLYKANRPASRHSELSAQLQIMRSAAEVLGMHPIEAEGFEADDVIATLAVRARKAGMRVTIISSDKDFGQLVEDGHIEIVDPLAKKRMRAADIEKKMGVPPKLVAHVQALAGDAVDNIIGVDGVGIERAAAMIRRFGNLEGVLANAKDCSWPSVRRLLVRPAVAEQVRLNLKLTTLKKTVKLDADPMAMPLVPVMKANLVTILKALGASHHMEAIFRLDPQASRLVAHEAKPWEWWEKALKGGANRALLPTDPQAGFYRTTLVRGGPPVGAAIWRETELDSDSKPTGMDVVRCEINGKPRDPFAEWVRLSMYPIPRSDFKFREAAAAYDRVYNPTSPAANPEKKIVLSEQPVSRNPRPVTKRKST